MELDPKVPPYRTSDTTSFAYTTVKDRWPVILTSALDDVHRTVSECKDEAKSKEGKAIVEKIAKLKYEVQHNRALNPVPDDGQPDVQSYNDELVALKSPKWFDLPWLYGECYLYRYLNTFFSQSEHWKSYDVFGRQKMSTFRSSRAAVTELAEQFMTISDQLSRSKSEKPGTTITDETAKAERLLFEEMCEICLWGNATDLSLLTSLTYDDIQKLQGSRARQASKQNIVVDDLGAAYDALRHDTSVDRRVDIVLDNSGFELYVDLILSSYFLTSGLASQIVLHPKSIPWFVSDVLPMDFGLLLNILANPRPFYEAPSAEEQASAPTSNSTSTSASSSKNERGPVPLTEKEAREFRFIFDTLATFHANGQLVIRPNRFWTQGGSFWRLPKEEPQLFADLQSSALVIFKGDLNYRKLTGDVMWDPTTAFQDAIGPLGLKSGVRTLALRTCKADVVVGLQVGEDERLRKTEGGGAEEGMRRWACNGKWAVVQFCDGKV